MLATLAALRSLLFTNFIQKEETPLDIARDSDYPKTVKVLTGRFNVTRLSMKRGIRNSSSHAGFPSRTHTSESTNSMSSFASASSAYSDIGRYTGVQSSTCSISENDVDDDSDDVSN